jgi:hypothetical protein
MNTKLLCMVLWLLGLIPGYAAGQPNLQSLIGREFVIHDDWAGQELAFRLKGESICAVWRILGSGRPVLSEAEYPVEVTGPNQCVFETQLRDKSRSRVKVEIGANSEVRAYVNGIRISLDDKKPNKASERAAPSGRG